MIAALYVEKGGVYYNLPDVDPWDKDRDARLYAGPWPVVAHPPCERWGSYWHGGPNSEKFPRARQVKGADGGCFAAALNAVRTWGGSWSIRLIRTRGDFSTSTGRLAMARGCRLTSLVVGRAAWSRATSATRRAREHGSTRVT